MTKDELLEAIDRAIRRARELDALDPRPTASLPRLSAPQRKENRRMDQVPLRRACPITPPPILEPAVLLPRSSTYRSHHCKRVAVATRRVPVSYFQTSPARYTELIRYKYHSAGEMPGTWEHCGRCDQESYSLLLPPSSARVLDDVPAHLLDVIPCGTPTFNRMQARHHLARNNARSSRQA